MIKLGKNDVCQCTIIHEDLVEKNKKDLLPEELLINVADFFKIFLNFIFFIKIRLTI